MKAKSTLLNIVVALSLLFIPLLTPNPIAANDISTPPAPIGPRSNTQAKGILDGMSGLAPEGKIDPSLRELVDAGSTEQVEIYVSVFDSVDLSAYMTDTIVRPVITPGMQYVFGKTEASLLKKIASHPGVISITDSRLRALERPYNPEAAQPPSMDELQMRMEELRANELTYEETLVVPGDVGASGWWDVNDGHKSYLAWMKGFTGNGVIVGVIDDGVDFAHPDLVGTTARVMDPDSPYFGWPMAFSQASLQYFARDVYLGETNIADGRLSSRWSDTQTTLSPVGGMITYQPLGAASAFQYRVTGTSLSSQYKIGSLPEGNLELVNGYRAAVLVVDEGSPGIYDTVYADLDNDHDFTDEKPATQESPEIYRDMNADGFADISGGMLVWISDGQNPPPVADWLWGITCDLNSPTMKGCPDNGDLVIFTGALRGHPYYGASFHGTLCASNVAAQGLINGGLSAQPFRVGGMVQGAAPDVGIMDLGDFYLSFAQEDHYLVATLGYDGIPYSGDEVQITSNSYGAFGQMWGGWGYIGRMLTSLNLTMGENTVHLFSAGNEGPGYGPQEGDRSPTAIQVGSSTQFGSTNWDSIFDSYQIAYGDPSAFYSKGPSRDGSIGVDVLANGGRGAGDQSLNYFGYNGASSWSTWGGTSRSAPVAAGNLALVFDAFNQRYGRWPTWYEAKALLKSGATNSVSSPFYQGGGVVNADRATDLAAGLYGVYTLPDEWRVGNWQGTEHLSFANVAYAGEVYTKTFEVTNPSDYAITVDLSDGVMTRISTREYTLTTANQSVESPDNPHTPDYLMPLPTADIPANAEVMVVRYLHTYDTFDPSYDFTPEPDSSWRFLLYNWTDQDGDGRLWLDKNGNGAVNHVNDLASGPDNNGYLRPDFAHPDTEIDEGEYVRLDDEYGGLGAPILVHDPLERMSSGYYFGVQHRQRSALVPATTFRIRVEFYQRADWDWLTLSDQMLSVSPRSSSTFQADLSVPAVAEPGAHEGVIFINDPGDPYHPPHETALPVIVNVVAEMDDGLVELGGNTLTPQMYQNSWTYGYFNWYGSGWTGAGDWRHYFLDLDSSDISNDNLLIHTWWEDTYPTDINTWVLGPTEDCASNGEAPCAWWEPGEGQPDQDVFGPYTLQPIASSSPLISGTAYPFDTSTGGPDDWLIAPLEREGLHEIALHHVLYAGDQVAAQFGVDVGIIAFDASVPPDDGAVNLEPGLIEVDSFTQESAVDLAITPSLSLPDLEFRLTDGLGTTSTTINTRVYDSSRCTDGPDCPETIWIPFDVAQDGSTRLEIFHDQPDGEDIDFYLYYDENGNGDWDPDIDTFIDQAINLAGQQEYIEVVDPELGTYLLGLLGWDLTVPSLEIEWRYVVTHPDELSSEMRQVFDDSVSIDQDGVGYPTSSYSMTLTTDGRTAGIHAELTEIPLGSNIDLYITDIGGSIVAQSINTGNADEAASVLSSEGEYRLGAGEDYTIWVHGLSVPSAPAQPNLHVWTDDCNIWLSSDHPQVIAHEIGAGETVTVTLNFARSAWQPGDADLSARFIGGPSVLEDAFNELVTIRRVNTPSSTPAPEFSVSKAPNSSRGLYPGLLPDIYRYGPAKAALAAPGELITYTLTVSNTGDAIGAFLLDDYWGDEYLDLVHLEAPPTAYTETYTGTFGTSTVWEGALITDTLDIGASTTITVVAQASPDIEPGYYYANFADVYDYTSEEYFETAWAGALYREFSTSSQDGLLAFSMKTSSDEDGRVVPGQVYDYQIELGNPSSEDVALTVIDPLPPDVNFIQMISGDSQYNPVTHTVTWEGILPGSSLVKEEFSFQVQVKGATPEGTVIFNQAEVLRDGEPVAYLDDTSLVDDLLDPDVRIEKYVNRRIALPGDILEYTINAHNQGVDLARNVHIIDPIPVGVTIDAGSIIGGAYYQDGAVHWVDDIPPGASYLITFLVQVDWDVHSGKALINRASITSDDIPETLYASAATEIEGFFNIFLPITLK